uniref:JAB domain-containing protein n=1 Tax=uncultured Altererythrobacter sp. TaxID=500840 RepID=UPI0026073EA4|nr:JAB domain-containing protein [uncultured Altererythrobacter sp.]
MIADRDLAVDHEDRIFDSQFASLFDYLRGSFELTDNATERLHVVFLDHNRRYLDDSVIVNGSANHLAVRLRELFARALAINASGVIVAHNHPSGDCRPSRNDIKATERLRDIGQALEIELLDHLIFTREKAYSMRAGGIL